MASPSQARLTWHRYRGALALVPQKCRLRRRMLLAPTAHPGCRLFSPAFRNSRNPTRRQKAVPGRSSGSPRVGMATLRCPPSLRPSLPWRNPGFPAPTITAKSIVGSPAATMPCHLERPLLRSASSTTPTPATDPPLTSRAACDCGSMRSGSLSITSLLGDTTHRSVRSTVARSMTTSRRTIRMKSTLARPGHKTAGSTIPSHFPTRRVMNETRLSRPRNWRAFCDFTTPTRFASSGDSSRSVAATPQTGG